MKKKTVILLSILGGILVLAGLSYAYYTSGIIGSERTSTVTINSGDIEIVVDGGENITAKDIVPSNRPFATKTITLTAKNTTALKAPYTIKLVVDNNTFTNGAIKYSLTGEGEAETGELIVNTTLEEINVTSYLGTGYFITGKNMVHTYTLKIYFPDTGVDQSEDMGKVFNAHIEVAGKPVNAPDGWYEAGSNTLLAAIKRNSALNTDDSILTKPGQEIADTDEQLRVAEDDYGTSYYFRGNVQNNYVIFANKCWKIVRVLGNGAIKLFYWGNVIDNKCGNADNTMKSAFISNTLTYTKDAGGEGLVYQTASGVGFMYGKPDSTTLYTTNSVGAQDNINKSTILEYLEDWYENNLKTNYSTYLADVIWCTDKALEDGEDSGTGYGEIGAARSNFRPRGRIYANGVPSNAKPSLICENIDFVENPILPKLTAEKSNVTKGNGDLNYSIGLITVDEAAFAGGAYGIESNLYYLFTGRFHWTLSPHFYTNSTARVWVVGIKGNINYGIVEGNGEVHPTIALIPQVELKDTPNQDGTANHPYIIN